MPVFYFLVIIGAAFIWLLLSILYKPIGSFFKKLIDDAKKNMEE